MDRITLTDNGQRVLNFLKDNDKVWVGKDLIDETGIKGIYPVLNSLKKHGLIEESEPVTRDFTNNKGVTIPKDYKTYILTDFGRSYQA